MKIVSYNNSTAHRKNKIAFKQMCKDLGFEYLECNKLIEIPEDTDLIWSDTTTIPPHQVPSKTKLLFGPGFFVFADPRHSLFMFEYANKGAYNCLSDWVIELQKEFIQGPRIPLVSCPLPIDTNTFAPDHTIQKKTDILFYFKNRHPILKQQVLEYFKMLPVSYKVFVYGSYNEKEYIEALHESKIVVWLGRHESQGFALQECLSMNVPILLIDTESMFDETDQETGRQYYTNEIGKYNLKGTAAPYWDDRCGIKITNVSGILENVEKMINEYETFRPREYILETLSSEACWARIKKTFQFV